MASTSQSYNATGPTVVAFETTSTNQAAGVSVTGKNCGVYGEASATLKGTRAFPRTLTGVHGRGNTGVSGEGISTGGQFRGDTGVSGKGISTGGQFSGEFVGCSADGKTGVKAQGSEIGILCTGGASVGVLIQSKGNAIDLTSEKVGINAVVKGKGPGIRVGSDGEGIDVSASGTGINAFSGDDRGGVFESREIAQIRLKPSRKMEPPAAGKVGDLFMRQDAKEPNTPSGVGLFLCVKDGSDQVPALWALIQLGTIVPGKP